MSADNWAICPRCKEKHDEDAAARMQAVSKSYGKVPAAEYLENLKNAEVEQPLENSLREDYESGMDESGEVHIYYGCSCNCGFGYSFRHEMAVPMTATHKEYEAKVKR